MTQKSKNNIYDCLIVGGGPAGFAAGIYAARYKLKTLLLAKEFGGTTAKASKVENYPGFASISGIELMQKFRDQYEGYGEGIKGEIVRSVDKQSDGSFLVKTDEEEYQARAVILALGKKRRHLDVPGEKEFEGKGVSYCATCDGLFFKDKVAVVVGGSDAAVMAAILLSQYVEKGYLIYRGDKLRAEPVWTERVENNKDIEIIYNTNVTEIKGDGLVQSIKLDKELEGSDELAVDGIFIEIGSDPDVELAKSLSAELNDRDLIKIDKHGATSVPGIFAAGDATNGVCCMEQIVTAAAEGAIAAYGVYDWLLNQDK